MQVHYQFDDITPEHTMDVIMTSSRKSALEIAWYVKKEYRHDFTKTVFLILIFNMHFHIDAMQFNLDLLLWSHIQAIKKVLFTYISFYSCDVLSACISIHHVPVQCHRGQERVTEHL